MSFISKPSYFCHQYQQMKHMESESVESEWTLETFLLWLLKSLNKDVKLGLGGTLREGTV